MGFSIELDEDTARRLHAEAARQGVDAQALGLQRVREGLVAPDRQRPSEEEMRRFDEALRELGEIARAANAPSLPDEALTRAGIYADHD